MTNKLRFLKLGFVGFLSLVIAVAITGRAYQLTAEKRDLAISPPPGQLFDIEGHLMHINCLGTGTPTMIIEQGAGTGGLAPALQDIHDRLSATTRVCAYDRAGVGYSEPVDIPTTSRQVTNDLVNLLAAANIDDELILIGFSRGGILVREFQKQFPDRVVGMVLVDSSHEDQYDRIPRRFPPATDSWIYYMAQYLQPLGLLRVNGLVDEQIQSFVFPEGEKHRAKALYNMSHSISTLLNELEGSAIDFDMLGPPEALGDLPLLVLSQGLPVEKFLELSPNIPLGYLQEQRRVLHEMHTELALLSTNSKRIIAEKSGHSIHVTEPDLLVESITKLLVEIRDSAL